MKKPSTEVPEIPENIEELAKAAREARQGSCTADIQAALAMHRCRMEVIVQIGSSATAPLASVLGLPATISIIAQ